ncbi:hypothetical protein AB870_03155 [Pandoraea faecigallinarum]|uniref:Glycosyl transferase family 8 n=1 Tax=Pandoraea faecigallinarum TaxID=656179 RepID=A0A0H3WS24_9BURK|nr:hypothetical protein [Pandoraea faecigallinarum]AKM29346.1 hypothetical protein AB870_03155 [Pandoraea faecigallinarum]
MTKPSQRAVPTTTPDAVAAHALAHAWAQVGAALSPHPDCPLPDWAGGGDTLHQHLLVIGNGGDDDPVSQLCYLETAAARFGKVGYVGPASVRRLVEWSMGDRVVVLSRMPRDVSDWDLRCALGSLARTLGPQATHAHAGRPFLRVATTAARHWRDRLAAAAQHGLCVGLAGLDTLDGMPRTTPPLAPLLGVPGVSWVPLGRPGVFARDAAPPETVDWIDWRADCDDLADEASLIDNLDLVIALDAAHAHMASGLGVPVWRLSATRLTTSHDDDWQATPFPCRRENSPTLADIGAFRLSPSSEDWPGVVNAAATALLAMATEFQGWTR